MSVVQIFLVSLEALQMKMLSWKIYKEDIWNHFELAQFGIFVLYVIARFTQTDLEIVPTEENKKDANRIQFWVILNTLLTGLIVLKLMYFMQVSINLAKIVKLTM
jgi:hypothetical protein